MGLLDAPGGGADFLAALVASCFLGMARSAERTQEGQCRALPGGLPAGGLAGGLLGAGHVDAGGVGVAVADALTIHEILLIIRPVKRV